MDGLAARSRCATAALCVAMAALPGPARAIAVPPGAAITVFPATAAIVPLLLIALPFAAMTRSDMEKVADYEAAGDWESMEDLAAGRAARGTEPLAWREIHARALLGQGRCRDALPSLRAVFDAHAALPSFSAPLVSWGLLLAGCEARAGDAAQAAAILERVAHLAPSRWEPEYLLAWLRRAQGDHPAADFARARLRVLHAPAADALGLAGVGATSAVHWPPQWVESGRFAIGGRALAMPAGTWFESGSSMRRIVASRLSSISVHNPESHPLFTIELAGRTASGAVLKGTFTANRARLRGVATWMVDDGCAGPQALHLDRYTRRFDQPECLSVRRAGDTYEVHYERYAPERMVSVRLSLPPPSAGGDEAVVGWARLLADKLRPLAEEASAPALEAQVPPLP